MIATVKIRKRFENKTNTGKEYVTVIDEKNVKYSVWDKPTADVLQEGVEASVDFYTKNGYHTIAKIVMANNADEKLDENKLEALLAAKPVAAPVDVSGLKPMQPSQTIAPKPELPEVVEVVHERIKAYEAATRLVVGMQVEYKDINRAADSALAYFHGTVGKLPAKTETEEAGDISEFIKKEVK